MPGATSSTVTVDGVEPSILVKLLNISDNPERVKIFTADDGTERWLYKDTETPVLVTPSDLAILGSVGIEIIPRQHAQVAEPQHEPQHPQQQDLAEGVVKSSPAITLGQSSPQA